MYPVSPYRRTVAPSEEQEERGAGDHGEGSTERENYGEKEVEQSHRKGIRRRMNTKENKEKEKREKKKKKKKKKKKQAPLLGGYFHGGTVERVFNRQGAWHRQSFWQGGCGICITSLSKLFFQRLMLCCIGETIGET